MKVDWNVPWVYSYDVEDLNAKVENWNRNVNICGKQKAIWTLLPPTEKEKKSRAKKSFLFFGIQKINYAAWLYTKLFSLL